MQDNQRLPNIIRGVSPCKDCKERFLACADHCPIDERGEFGYLAWKAQIKEIENKRNAYNNLNRRKYWQK